MSKDPAVLFYTSDFLTGTAFMTDEQTGQYIRLLCLQHQHGHLTDAHFIKICKKIDPAIMAKFEKTKKGDYHNIRMHTEIEKRANFCESRRKNRSMGKVSKIKSKNYGKQHTSNTSLTYVEHMEDENEDEDINKNIDAINSILINKSDKFKEAFNSFLDMRKKINKSPTVHAKKLLLIKLKKLSEDEKIQIEIIEQSIMNSYQGFFLLTGQKPLADKPKDGFIMDGGE